MSDMEKPTRENVSALILQQATKLAERAEEISKRASDKLAPIMNQQIPQEEIKGEKSEMEYPPYFAELRGKFDTISQALDAIKDAISRTEI